MKSLLINHIQITTITITITIYNNIIIYWASYLSVLQLQLHHLLLLLLSIIQFIQLAVPAVPWNALFNTFHGSILKTTTTTTILKTTSKN